MNNKGFAITGILYTLFVLFIMVLLSILATISYKKGILEKTILSLEDDFYLTEVTDLSSTYDEIERRTTLDGKYVFKLIRRINNQDITVSCSVYLKKGDKIPISIPVQETTTEDFILIPNDCNEYVGNIILNSNSMELNTLILDSVSEFKGSD